MRLFTVNIGFRAMRDPSVGLKLHEIPFVDFDMEADVFISQCAPEKIFGRITPRRIKEAHSDPAVPLLQV